jgi:hypothetical protein
LGIGDWAQSPIPNPQSPIPNPQSPLFFINYKIYIFSFKIIINKKIYLIVRKNEKSRRIFTSKTKVVG